MSTPKLNLHYFPFAGRAGHKSLATFRISIIITKIIITSGPIRQALQFGQIEYTETHIGREFPELQASGVWPFDSLPILEVGEGEDLIVLSQSNAILNYVGNHCNKPV